MKQLALVIDLNVCVGCHACVTSCKEWNTSGWAGPMTDHRPYDRDPTGNFFNRVQTFEVGDISTHITCSVGVCAVSKRFDSFEEFISATMSACEEARKSGGSMAPR